MKKLAKILDWLGNFEEKKARDEYLESKGHDLDELEKNGIEIFRESIAKQKLKKAQKKKQLLKRARELLQEQSAAVSIKSILSNMETSGSKFSYKFSKLDKVSNEDALKMFNDEQLLKLIDQLEEKNDE